RATHGRWRWSQWGLAVYFAMGMLLLLKGLDLLLKRWTRAWRAGASDADAWRRVWRRSSAITCRVVVLFAVGLPYVMSAIMIYRPKVVPVEMPDRPFEVVQFEASDGTDLVGWWIP